MHGRLKVKTTAEQQEAKRKEREKKLKIYNAAVQKISVKRQQQEYDEEALHITAEILTSNSDFYSLWNYRKEIFKHFGEEKSEEELQTLYQQELYFLEACLKGNPKSYGTWHHRCFVLDNMPKPDWERELQLCNQFLEYDERNFHCWDYRRFVVSRSKVSLESEFEFTTTKISSNFSNYSSWHYRSKLLPAIFPDPNQPRLVQENQMLQEHETVQNAFFTDPDDQSAWFYHRWLLGRGETSQQICQMYVSREASRVIVSLAKHIQVVELETTSFWIESEWITIPVRVEHMDCQMNQRTKFPDCVESGFSSELSSATSDVMKRELDAVRELYSLEPENKWVLLTIVLLMKSLCPVLYKDEILEHLQQLQNLDNKRRNYWYINCYCCLSALRSKMLIEIAIDTIKGKLDDVLDLSNQGLTTLVHLELLPLIREVKLSDNSLDSFHNFQYLQCLEKLNISGNQITSCEGLNFLPELSELDLRNNSISSKEALEALLTCPKLKVVHLSGNPVRP
ncbi:geranylgeranyl transferase type-2 subunit alpha-like [Haliotis rubra]|uniref:geranylgeranyl transferase type-2 subunit alpha-like n=1 Tax=Haliotis rubra TaxID=36100 RepID=UPI001EE54EEA|nr:geranylgeranyl transferase type-2 subunit alpha-like [Haliotis rubra]